MFAFDKDKLIQDSKLPIEARLVECLRVWSDAPGTVLASGRTVEQEVQCLLEGFITDCIVCDPAGSLEGWWSDGVIQLRIERRASDAFKLIGVTWIGCDGLAPFEIDVNLSTEDDTYFSRCVFRVGLVDQLGRPALGEPGHLVDFKPRSNSEWAMAVELTPLKQQNEDDDASKSL